jgi:hypothetical protein
MTGRDCGFGGTKARAIAFLVSVTIAACGSPGAPTSTAEAQHASAAAPSTGVPGAFLAGVCRSAKEVEAAIPFFQAMSDHADAQDWAAVKADIAEIKRINTRAQAQLDQVPTWPPGDPVVEALSAGLEEYQAWLNQMTDAIDNLDVQAIRDAGLTMMDAGDHMSRAMENMRLLERDYSVSCPTTP